MEARSIPAALAPAAHADARAPAVPWPLVATVFAATSIIVGLIWDISWHISIGRDTFWTPAHMGIYLGGSTAGLANGFLVLRTSFGRDEAARDRAVRFWGFRGPLGAFVSIWGAGAMLTSAPFDDWWHAAYGLDVEILSPPHTVLLAGILFVIGGACMTALTAQNDAEAAGSASAGRYRAIFAYALGLLATMGALAVWEQTRPYLAHSSRFYLYAAVPFPFLLAAAGRALRLRWPATTVAAIYSALLLVTGWALAPWPATPKLGPIHQDVTHMVSLGFPLLLVAPALAFDLLARALPRARATVLAAALGAAFVATMLATHWWFGAFLLSPASHNALFMGDHLPYSVPRAFAWSRGEFFDVDGSPAALARGLGVAVAVAVLTARGGLALGGWMRTVRR
ncbi:hypothetical protein [Roseisolibacter sp. H3M3-2]|uniref:hypothetical protein n=1 Tax=Roseisolibacter sp. H3M3-2 TaxID=3031323 RepID=UPI0023DBA245|nr:hypothetical protein [Roseisolibacter sp. H3M3-2]MDF1502088.1 hypothetical protein [Roseisolibacter sp. H3M3-2]